MREKVKFPQKIRAEFESKASAAQHETKASLARATGGNEPSVSKNDEIVKQLGNGDFS